LGAAPNTSHSGECHSGRSHRFDCLNRRKNK
jgi:hypothetical protein